MKLKLIDVIKEAERRKVAIGHFNVSNFEMLKVVAGVAKKMDLPVIIGVSEGEREYIGTLRTKDIVDSYNKEHTSENVPALMGGFRLFLNADHTYSVEKAKEVIDAGYDMIVFDGANQSFKENIKLTKEVVGYARSKNVLVEGELGYIGKSSKVLKEVPEGARIKIEDLPTAEEAHDFVKETGLDALAPAVGNIHGLMKNAANPNLQIERIKEIRKAVGIPLVLHGGSGVKDEEFKEAIRAGVSVIHVSTELRVAWREGLEEALNKNPDEIAPYKLSPVVLEKMEKVVESKLKLFNE